MAKKSIKAGNGEGSIRKTKNGKWEVRFTKSYDPVTRKQKMGSKTFDKKADAIEFKLQVLNSINDGTYVSPNKQTVREFLIFYMQTYTMHMSPLGRKAYEDRIRIHIVPFLGDVPLCKLTREKVQEFANHLITKKSKLGKPLSEKTIREIHAVLRKALNVAVDLDYIKINPATHTHLPKVVDQEIIPFEFDEVVALLKEAETDRFSKLISFCLFTGMRQGEIIGLTWDCIDWDKKIIHVRKQLYRKKKMHYVEVQDDQPELKYAFGPVKHKQTRKIEVKDEIINLLKERYEEQLQQREIAKDLWHEPFPGLVFEDEYGRNISHNTLYKHYKSVVAAIGKPEEYFHGLRHNHAIISFDNGDDYTTVQKRLGHSEASTTWHYYDGLSQTRVTKSADNFDKYIKSVKEQM